MFRCGVDLTVAQSSEKWLGLTEQVDLDLYVSWGGLRMEQRCPAVPVVVSTLIGEVIDFVLASSSSVLNQIAAGPNGAMWLSEHVVFRIGPIGTGHNLTKK